MCVYSWTPTPIWYICPYIHTILYITITYFASYNKQPKNHGRDRSNFHSITKAQAKALHHWSLGHSCDRPLPFIKQFFPWRACEGNRQCMQRVGVLPSDKPWSPYRAGRRLKQLKGSSLGRGRRRRVRWEGIMMVCRWWGTMTQTTQKMLGTGKRCLITPWRNLPWC